MRKSTRINQMKKLIKILKLLWDLPNDLWLMFITYLPGKSGFGLRRTYWKKRFKSFGKNVIIDIGTYFQNPRFISVGDNVWIDRYVQILAGTPSISRITYYKENLDFSLTPGEVFIGQQVHIAPNCILSGIGGIYIGKFSGISANTAIYSFSHHYKNLTDKTDLHQYYFTPQARSDQQAMISGPVYIGDYCGIGANTVILPGVSIKKGSLVGSNSLVIQSIPERSVYSTNQSYNIKSITDLDIIDG